MYEVWLGHAPLTIVRPKFITTGSVPFSGVGLSSSLHPVAAKIKKVENVNAVIFLKNCFFIFSSVFDVNI
ncbi:hypothetical protein JCM19300_2763 [Algibacter lectus]|uniref:Uncharacterized protein n=1 Tax=Algibacter lectus TaxID=221126 RepID=A0A090W865_9FLAO|nr:hypothetical protein JCM19300_2763 [Algibacter lectus]